MKTKLIASATALGLVIACSAPAPETLKETPPAPSGQKAPVPPKPGTPPKAPPEGEPAPGPGVPGPTPGPGTGTPPKPPTQPTQPTVECKPGTDPNACHQCCDTKFPGSQKLDAAFVSCMCTTPGVCKSQCGSSYCANQEPSDACFSCQGIAQCSQQIDQQCAADPTCKGYFACLDACEPQGQGGDQDVPGGGQP